MDEMAGYLQSMSTVFRAELVKYLWKFICSEGSFIFMADARSKILDSIFCTLLFIICIQFPSCRRIFDNLMQSHVFHVTDSSADGGVNFSRLLGRRGEQVIQLRGRKERQITWLVVGSQISHGQSE